MYTFSSTGLTESHIWSVFQSQSARCNAPIPVCLTRRSVLAPVRRDGWATTVKVRSNYFILSFSLTSNPDSMYCHTTIAENTMTIIIKYNRQYS